jgi:PAS domain-containing protein
VGETESTYSLARDLQQPVYSQPAAGTDSTALLQLHIPLSDQGRFSGVLLAEYSIDGLLRYGVPAEVLAKYAVSFLDAKGRMLAGSAVPDRAARPPACPGFASQPNEYEVPVSPVGNGLVLRAQAYRASLGVVGSGLFWLVSALSAMTAWMLIGNWRHTRRRMQAQQALVSETNFRRAMENSMLTGMRALDMQGRITYVNAAFCQMTGWSEAELVGAPPPFPYWPDADREQLAARLDDELSGAPPPAASRCGSSARTARCLMPAVRVAPDRRRGQANRLDDLDDRHHRAQPHSRAAVGLATSASPPCWRRWTPRSRWRRWAATNCCLPTSCTACGLARMDGRATCSWWRRPACPTAPPVTNPGQVDSFAGLPTDTPPTRSPRTPKSSRRLDKWLEVRSRYLNWVDGRLAQMVIATDITARRLAEEQAAAQAERAQSASRLITMGEMASSVAHELNQPLTAINNYCNGMISRIKGSRSPKKTCWARWTKPRARPSGPARSSSASAPS